MQMTGQTLEYFIDKRLRDFTHYQSFLEDETNLTNSNSISNIFQFDVSIEHLVFDGTYAYLPVPFM